VLIGLMQARALESLNTASASSRVFDTVFVSCGCAALED
jgi:hypothetical protein